MRGLAKFCVKLPVKWGHYQQERRYNDIIKDARNRTNANNKKYEALVMRQTSKICRCNSDCKDIGGACVRYSKIQ